MTDATFDLESQPWFADDPYPLYAQMREAGAAHRMNVRDGVTAWIVPRYEDARVLLNDPRLSKDPRNGPPEWQNSVGENFGAGLGDHLLNADPPKHTRLRRLVSAAFTPRRLEALRPRVQEIADELLDAVVPTGQAELIGDFASLLPITVICELLGLPREDRGQFRAWSLQIITAGDAGAGEAPRDAMREAFISLYQYFIAIIEKKRQAPQDDLISALIEARDEGDKLNDQELVSMMFVLLLAGFETTMNLIGNGTLALLRNPDQLEALRRDPSLVPSAVEEFLRYDGPVELALWRFTTEPVEVGGVTIPQGEAVLIALAGADRDPAAFKEPDRLDVAREDNHHVAFGHGIHFCIGANLARLEGKIAFETMLRRLPGLALGVEDDALEWRVTSFVRGLRALPLKFDPAATARKGT